MSDPWWTDPYVGGAWLNGKLSTDELHEHCTDAEYLRAQRDHYTEMLIVRYDRALRGTEEQGNPDD